MATDAVIEFQPLLGRIEVEVLIRSISKLLDSDRKEALTGVGIDFSGRQWTRGMLTRETLQDIAQLYFSVQTLHSPLTSLVVARRAKGQPEAAEPARIERAVQDITNLPAVALLDTGVPQQHSVLSVYRRGSYVAPDSYGQPVGYHGSFVASRIVFGDLDFGDTAPSTPREAHCRFYDALVASSQSEIDDKSVVPAIQGVVATAPDVRVFNLSFDTQPLLQLDSTKRRENLFLVQDLDNLVFRDDLLVVVAAGNSKPGVIPATPYPNHYDDESWQLGAWARSFNSLTCGSHVARLRSGGIVSRLGWPSPFTRVGPGLCESPKPDFSAHGGDLAPGMRRLNGLGVWGLTDAAMWEDRSGTSFAAPLLAREAALTFQRLQSVCSPGARPYAVTVKAFLALTATRPSVTGAAALLAKRALGRGEASHERLDEPYDTSAVVIWQGLLESPRDIVRITLPIPRVWHRKAGLLACA